MSYPLDFLNLFFAPSEVRRGKSYYQAGRVSDIEFLAGDYGFDIAALVQGSASQPYYQNITVFTGETEFDWNEVDIEGDCSCPVGYNCKHVAAVLFALEQRILPEPLTSKPISTSGEFVAWLDQVSETLPVAESNEVSQQTFSNQLIVYELHVSRYAQAEDQLVIKLVKTRRLKSGELSKAQSNEISLFNHHGSERYLSKEDLEIIPALEVCARRLGTGFGFSYQGIRISGHIGFIALGQILRTGRMYLGNYRENRLLTLGDRQKLEPYWFESQSGHQKLALAPDAHVFHLFDTTPLMALAPDKGEIFEVETDIDRKRLFQLVSVPEISPEESVEISETQKTALSKLGIPTPASIQTKDIDVQSKQPTLKLCLARDPSGQVCVGGYALLPTISYNQFPPIPALDGEQVVSQYRDGILERLIRDFEFERETVSHLTDHYPVRDLSEFAVGRIPRTGYLGFENLADWYAFLETGLPDLKSKGWEIDQDEEFDLAFNDIDGWYAEVDQDTDHRWFDLALNIEVGGETLPLLPILLNNFRGLNFTDCLESLQANPQGKQPITVGENRHILLPNERLIPLLQTFVELFDRDVTLEDGKLRLRPEQELRLLSISSNDWAWRNSQRIAELEGKFKAFSGIETTDIPKAFKGKLRDYQAAGVSWLQFLRQFSLGGILSDDMGLGKTVQTLAHLCVEKSAGRTGRPCLIVAPTSLMGNWRNEAARFCPWLSLLVLHGQERHQHFDQIEQYDLVLTSYALIVRDEAILSQHHYHYLILDESQKIKNHQTKAAKTLQELTADYRLCLTGTPMENHLGELWSQFDFLMPGFLGDEKEFTKHYRRPVEKHQDHLRQGALQKRISPVLLRRTKELVAKELPQKTEIIQTISLSGSQRDLYETIRLMMDKKVKREIAKKGMARSHIMILDALLKLRQVCCHPGLLSLKSAKNVKESAKLKQLMNMLPELVEEGRKVLLFSQFTSMLSVIEKKLKDHGLDYVKLTGRTKDRETPVNQFQSGKVPVFLISLKAGGTGLNLTRADTVIHYDPWWNPAVENQATDRAHRIGQDKPVFVYKLVTEHTVESKILEMQQRKRQLAEQTLEQGAEGAKLTEDDLRQLFSPISVE